MFFRKPMSFFIAILATGLSLVSCIKDRDSAQDTDTSLAQSYSYVEQNNNEINNLIVEVIEKDTILSLKTDDLGDQMSSCVNLTKKSIGDTLIITIDFGINNCLCKDQKYRKGKIILHALNNKSWAKAESENFYVNDNLIEGSRNMMRNGLEISLSGFTKITFGDSAAISEDFNRKIIFTEGFLTNNDATDDVFQITGSTSGISKKGLYTTEITTPLKRKRTCVNIVSGVLEITPAEKLTRKIDFGNGECNNLVTVSVGKYSKIIALQ